MRVAFWKPTPVAALTKAWVCGCSLFGNTCSKPAEAMDVCLLWVLCCQVEVSASDWSLVQRSPTEYGVSECDNEVWIIRRWPSRGCCTIKNNILKYIMISVPPGLRGTSTSNVQANQEELKLNGAHHFWCTLTALVYWAKTNCTYVL